MCWFLRLRLASHRKVAEKKARSLKSSMSQSFNKFSSSMSSMTGQGSSRGRQPGGPACQKKTGKTRTNAPIIDPNGKRAKSKKPSNNDTEVKRKKKKQKTASTGLPSLPESITNTLPSLCKIFKKPQRQHGTSIPSRDFRKHYMCQTWEDNYVQISPLHDIMEEEEEEEEEDEF